MTSQPNGQIGLRLFSLLFTVSILSACASAPDLTPVPTPTQAVPTLTPFAPGSNINFDSAVTAQPQTLPTYTPYPTQYVAGEGMPTPIEVPPVSGSVPDYNALYQNNPLTGLPVSDPALLERRPMAIKVANSPDYVRPQSGLSLADIVYEYYIEWGDTRFIAVFYGNDSPYVGPVRSGRYFDEHIARMYNAFLVFKFADPREFSYLKNSTLNEFLVVPTNGACPPFVLGGYNRDTYNNIFFDTLKWAKCAAKKGLDNTRPELRGGFFTDSVAESALQVSRIYTYFSKYSYNYWEYDPATHKYFRYQEANDMVDNKPEAYTQLTDAQTSLPVTAENVVHLFVPYTFANSFDAHDEVYHIDLVDSGSAYIFRDGLAIPAKWERTDVNQPILLTTLMGTPIYLRPGRTFYEVVGVTSSYTQEGTDWKFKFATP